VGAAKCELLSLGYIMTKSLITLNNTLNISKILAFRYRLVNDISYGQSLKSLSGTQFIYNAFSGKFYRYQISIDSKM
jgi:hypothetical protein